MKRSITYQLIASAIFLLVFALGFNALLSLNSLEKLYVESIASQYSAIGKDLQINLEKSLRFGKKIEKFLGMEKMLEDTRQNLIKSYFEESSFLIEAETSEPDKEIVVSVALPDGTIIYSKLVGVTLPEESWLQYDDSDDASRVSDGTNYVKYEQMYVTMLPVRDMKKQWVATAIIAFDEKQVTMLLKAVRNNTIKMIAGILGASIGLLLLLFKFAVSTNIQITDGAPTFSKKGISVVMLLVIGAAQIVFSVWNTSAFGTYYLQINKQKARTLTALQKEDVEYFFSKGITIQKLVKMEAKMGDVIHASPELSDMLIVDAEGMPLYMATKADVFDFQKTTEDQFRQAYRLIPVVEPEYTIRLALRAGDDIKGYISANLSRDVLFARLFETALDAGTILVISLLFFGELLILIFVYIERQITSTGQQQVIHYTVIRPAAFLFLFGIDISISFLPLHMEKLYEPILGLSKDMVMGLPISVEMLFVGISIIIAGSWLDRRGWYGPFFSGIFLTGAGIFYSWLAPDALHFIVSRGIVGLGYGFTAMACQGFVIFSTSQQNKAQGLAQLFAGVYAGSICGGAVGAMLAERIGYNPVFFLGAVIVFSVIIYTLLFMRSAIQKPEPRISEPRIVAQPKPPIKGVQGFQFLFNRNILGLIVFSAIPAAIAFKGFFNYFTPVYLNRIGASQSNIGRVFMIHGICLIYFAPFISKYIDASRSRKNYIVLSGIIGGFAFLGFYFFGGLAITAFAILLLGLSESVNASRPYALKLQITQKLGEGKAMAIFSSAGRIGQVLGPMAFGWLIIGGDISKGVTYFGLFYLLATLIFWVFTRNDKQIASESS